MMPLRPILAILLAGVLPACAAPPGPVPAPPAGPATAGETRVLDEAAAAQLMNADGITLQWIGWNQRGQVYVREEAGQILLTGSQGSPDGPGKLFVDGVVTEIGADYFLLVGLVRITDVPDPGRRCEARKAWRFAITQNRPYWRLREFEWCDGLTDYVDIYF